MSVAAGSPRAGAHSEDQRQQASALSAKEAQLHPKADTSELPVDIDTINLDAGTTMPTGAASPDGVPASVDSPAAQLLVASSASSPSEPAAIEVATSTRAEEKTLASSGGVMATLPPAAAASPTVGLPPPSAADSIISSATTIAPVVSNATAVGVDGELINGGYKRGGAANGPDGYYDEVEIEDMEYDSAAEEYRYPCPCGDTFRISKDELLAGEDIARCASCSLLLKVIYDPDDLEDDD